LEAEGFRFSTAGGRLRVRPTTRLTPELRDRLHRERDALLVLLRICDDGVQRRREAFVATLAAETAAVLPALVFTPDVPYVAGKCFSCAQPNDRPTFGRCWRCALAWRLALGLPISSDFAAAYDAAKRVA
jgi:hypothetical protein